jgi:hypothetical protein
LLNLVNFRGNQPESRYLIEPRRDTKGHEGARRKKVKYAFVILCGPLWLNLKKGVDVFSLPRGKEFLAAYSFLSGEVPTGNMFLFYLHGGLKIKNHGKWGRS